MLLPERWGAPLTAIPLNAAGLLSARIAAVAAMQLWQWARVIALAACAAAAVCFKARSQCRPVEIVLTEHAAELLAFVLALVWYSGGAEVVFAQLIMDVVQEAGPGVVAWLSEQAVLLQKHR